MDSKSYSLEQLAASLDDPALYTLDKLQLTSENAVLDQNKRFKQRANSKLLSVHYSNWVRLNYGNNMRGEPIVLNTFCGKMTG